jgi:hypothetical protein
MFKNYVELNVISILLLRQLVSEKMFTSGTKLLAVFVRKAADEIRITIYFHILRKKERNELAITNKN